MLISDLQNLLEDFWIDHGDLQVFCDDTIKGDVDRCADLVEARLVTVADEKFVVLFKTDLH